MKNGANKRLSNIKTRTETGFDFVSSKLNICTQLGKNAEKSAKPYFPGEEALLDEELDKVEILKNLAENQHRVLAEIQDILHCLKDITGSIERAGRETLSMVELYEIKSLLIYTENLGRILKDAGNIPEEFIPIDTGSLLDVMDPKGDRINTFYIYDEYSKKLATYRARKKELDVEIRKLQKIERDKLKENYGILLTPKFDIVIPKSSEIIDTAKGLTELDQITEDYTSITFVLAMPEGSEPLIAEREDLNLKIEDEEQVVRKTLSDKIGERRDDLLANSNKIGRLDYVLAKALYATESNSVRPNIISEHRVNIENGRQLQVEEVLRRKGKEYVPISIDLRPGVSCITGANMGGKTISLKLAGLIPIMTQYGYFVPCERAEIGLSNFVQILIGDSQSVERGLSSFGSEMEELKEILDNAEDRSLILVDEIASGTNPAEGLALTKSIVEYLSDKPYISLLTTHYETVTNSEVVKNMQVRGLADVDFRKLNSELSQATTKRARIDTIGKYMDYRLVPVAPGEDIPKDAINIARMLGLPDEIIQSALDNLSTEE